jgi:SAM-dependent methyltransferase
MSSDDHPWERIYKEEGRGEKRPFHRFYEVVGIFRSNGCRQILDLGCGSGRHFIHLAREGFEVVGVDLSPTALRLTKGWAVREGCEDSVILADMRSPLPFRTSSFDGVFSTQVIHHAYLLEIERTIQEIFRVLGCGGMAFVTVSACRDETEHIEIEPNTFIPLKGPERGVPHHIFTEENLRKSFQAFHILEVSLRAEGKVWAVLAQKG